MIGVTGSPGEHSKVSMDERRWVILQADVREQQRIAAIFLAILTGQLKDRFLHCTCGYSTRLGTGTLDIHHRTVGDGPKERKEWGRKYYGVLASRFLFDLTHRTTYYKNYELICRDCHELRHGKSP